MHLGAGLQLFDRPVDQLLEGLGVLGGVHVRDLVEELDPVIPRIGAVRHEHAPVEADVDVRVGDGRIDAAAAVDFELGVGEDQRLVALGTARP
jgi:hypothetical protein